MGGEGGFDQVLGFTDVKLATTFTFYLVDYHCGFAFPLLDAGTIDFVRVPTVTFWGVVILSKMPSVTFSCSSELLYFMNFSPNPD